jgi:hypothetical protein
MLRQPKVRQVVPLCRGGREQNHRIAQNKAVKEYRKAKRQFEKKLAKDIKSNPKSFYAYVRSKTKVKDVVGPLKDSNNQLISDNGLVCELPNEYFGTVFTSKAAIRPNDPTHLN